MSFFARWRFIVCLSLVLSGPAVAVACLWDVDTLRMERSRFPSVLELITGKFLRHSPEFYRWRIENRQQRLGTDPQNIALWDDLAVAYDKTGQHEKAIETAWKAEQLRPGRYESAANLGTFYIHAGKMDEGLKFIDQALAINPNAHFGRERYQRWLVEYVLQRQQDGVLELPMIETPVPELYPHSATRRYIPKVRESFATFVQQKERLAQAEAENKLGNSTGSGSVVPADSAGGVHRSQPVSSGADPFGTADINASAIKGVLGMMRFGQHDSPILLEALGSLLSDGAEEWDGKQMAARAYLRAAAVAPNARAKEAYRQLAGTALVHQIVGNGGTRAITLEEVEADLAAELADAEAWYQELRQRELSWIAAGLDPEALFARLYDQDPVVTDFEPLEPAAAWNWDFAWLLQDSIGRRVVLALGLVTAVVVFRWRWGRIEVRRSEASVLEEKECSTS
jgi:tetratricopeptide (TPR) repeat protein